VLLLLAAACAPLATEYRFTDLIGSSVLEFNGELYRPEGAGPFPAVILLHGSGGIGPRQTRMREGFVEKAEWIRAQGYVAFVLDSFSARELPYRGAGITTMRSYDRADDVRAAVRFLKTLPFVRSDRIAVMGWSHGGGAAIATRNRERRHPETPVAAFVAYYPPCRDFVWFKSSAPLLILIGDQDQLTPAEDCRELAEEARHRQEAVEFVVYPGVTHAFDSDSIPLRGIYLGPAIGKGEFLKYDPAAHHDSQERVRRFLGEHLRH
jgi:dienelactone hydrolase